MTWYDDVQSIYLCLSRDGLDGLRQLIEARMSLPDERRREMQDLIIRKRFVLRSDGLWRILDAEIHEGHRVGAAVHFSHGSDAELKMRQRQRFVMTIEEAGDVMFSSTSVSGLPDTPCDRCHGTWTLDNFHEARLIEVHTDNAEEGHQEDWHRRRPHVWRHLSCEQIRQIQDGFEELRAIVDATPFRGVPLRLIPNMYWPNAVGRDYPVDPWAILETSFGEIRIGWRKRVIHIDWDRAPGLASVSGSSVVARSDITNGATMVHCYGTEKASEALRRLHELSAGKDLP